MNRVDLEQGTEEWLEWRRDKAMASETAAIMGVSPYQSAEKIRKLKRGIDNTYVTSAMQYGTDEEPKAREAYEAAIGEPFVPACFEFDDFGASVDGIDMSGDTLLEIKCPVKGRESDRWRTVEDDGIEQHDYIQVQHQMMVTGARETHFLVWDGEEYVVTVVKANPDFWKKIEQAWKEFWPTVQERDDEEWREAAERYRLAKEVADKANAELDDAKKALIDITGGRYSSGHGVEVLKVERKGSIDWKKVQKEHLPDVDLEPYRKKGSEFYQVKESRDD